MAPSALWRSLPEKAVSLNMKPIIIQCEYQMPMQSDQQWGGLAVCGERDSHGYNITHISEVFLG